MYVCMYVCCKLGLVLLNFQNSLLYGKKMENSAVISTLGVGVCVQG
jgi:hypothetical protein